MVQRLPNMVSMELDEEEQKEIAEPMPPKYPYGLCICLCEDELEKLGLMDLSGGETIHFFCMAKVTSVSNDADGSNKRVSLQITEMAGESEDEENESVTGKLYSGTDYL